MQFPQGRMPCNEGGEGGLQVHRTLVAEGAQQPSNISSVGSTERLKVSGEIDQANSVHRARFPSAQGSAQNYTADQLRNQTHAVAPRSVYLHHRLQLVITG